MKTRTLLLMPVVIGLAISPVLRAEPPGTTTTTTVHTGVWKTVPEDYDGDYFTYNNQYYYGGKYEKGDFTWEGRHYPDRYYHDGKWIYGGKWEHHARKEARKAEKREEHRERDK